jgi:hypothetical protein
MIFSNSNIAKLIPLLEFLDLSKTVKIPTTVQQLGFYIIARLLTLWLKVGFD